MRKKKNNGFTLIELLAVLVILAIIISITFQIVTTRIEKSKNNLYEIQINNIIDASKKYMLENPNIDKYHINTICKSISVLQENGYLEKGKIVNPKTNEDMVSKYKFKVKYNFETNQYDYEVTDICVESIRQTIRETITSSVDVKVASSGDGLYETNDSYVYRGTNPNNYIKLGNNSIWRIVSIDKESNMTKIINLNGSQYTWPEAGLVSTLNIDFSEGSTYDSIKNSINVNSKWNKNILTKIDSALTVKSIEKQVSDYKTIGLLTVGEYIDASLDSECYKNNNCNSYLNKKTNYWLFNQALNNENWYVDKDGKINKVVPSESQLYYGYPVLYLKVSEGIKSGVGSEEDPYILY